MVAPILRTLSVHQDEVRTALMAAFRVSCNQEVNILNAVGYHADDRVCKVMPKLMEPNPFLRTQHPSPTFKRLIRR